MALVAKVRVGRNCKVGPLLLLHFRNQVTSLLVLLVLLLLGLLPACLAEWVREKRYSVVGLVTLLGGANPLKLWLWLRSL